MAYPRNAASPPRILIGPVISAGGSIISAGASVALWQQSAASEVSAAGTIEYGALSKALFYTPTQGETDVTAFIATAYQTGCIPVGTEVVPSANATAGRVSVGDVAGTAQTGGDIVANQAALSAQISGIGSGTGAALNFAIDEDNASSPIKTISSVGTQTGTFANTLADDGTTHQIDSVANAIDWVYGASCGAGRAASKVVLRANMAAVSDTVTVSAYNFDTTSWDARTSITGTTETVYDIPLLSGHTGKSGADLGKVYIRFQFSEGDAGTLVVDQAYVSAQQSGSLIGYADGAVWVKAAGTAASVPYVNATADNPAPWANAKVVAAAVGLTRYHIINGEVVTLDSTMTNNSMLGKHWDLALGTQEINDLYVEGADVTGVATTGAGSDCILVDCTIGAATVPRSTFYRSGMGRGSGQFTAGSAGEYKFVDCYSCVPGSGTPVFDFSGQGSATGINFRRWSGGSSITLDGDCTLTMEVLAGGGQTINCSGAASVEIRGICRAITLTGITSATTVQIDCVTGPISISGDAGTVRIYGVCGEVTDSRTGSPTLVNDAISNSNITSSVLDEVLTGHDTADTLGEVIPFLYDAAIGGTKSLLPLKAEDFSSFSFTGDLQGGTLTFTATIGFLHATTQTLGTYSVAGGWTKDGGWTTAIEANSIRMTLSGASGPTSPGVLSMTHTLTGEADTVRTHYVPSILNSEPLRLTYGGVGRYDAGIGIRVIGDSISPSSTTLATGAGQTSILSALGSPLSILSSSTVASVTNAVSILSSSVVDSVTNPVSVLSASGFTLAASQPLYAVATISGQSSILSAVGDVFTAISAMGSVLDMDTVAVHLPITGDLSDLNDGGSMDPTITVLSGDALTGVVVTLYSITADTTTALGSWTDGVWTTSGNTLAGGRFSIGLDTPTVNQTVVEIEFDDGSVGGTTTRTMTLTIPAACNAVSAFNAQGLAIAAVGDTWTVVNSTPTFGPQDAVDALLLIPTGETDAPYDLAVATEKRTRRAFTTTVTASGKPDLVTWSDGSTTQFGYNGSDQLTSVTETLS